ncbi:ATP-binding protein [Paenibacillus pini]|uniref:ORC1/DEAH AAA+ ATPase domain-containing protein n=1 Tax=Paenibacillus pini JCM 16418 TaxID=1236976 RepID=W7YID1_9BACL|nr:ATP-binding protein [Paenibacillus pini]GAF07378.1 hypothetical protein JCM16418_1394 [Paenibacillus pini JCM 16418]
MAKVIENQQDSDALSLSTRPDIPLGSHPVETEDYQIPTNEILKVFAAVTRWIKLRVTGATIYGRPRLGKTWMVKFLEKNLSKELEVNLPIHHIVSLHSKIAKEEEFLETLLSDMGHDFAFTGKTSVKRNRLIAFLYQQGNANRYRIVLLFIDEAQCLEELHYEWLIDYYNKLDKLNITLILILVGQEQLNGQQLVFSHGHADQIIQRFMIEEHKFVGIRTLEDIKVCLKCYDELSEYPAGSGWSFTRYYFPEAFAAGERLQNFSKEIFEIFTTLRQKYNLKGVFEIPMKHMTMAIKIVLLDYGKNSSKPQHWISKKNWVDSILKTNYIISEQRKNPNSVKQKRECP